MLLKSATSLAFATACMTALATAPGAMAQSANPNGAYGPTYQGEMAQPASPNGAYGSTYQTPTPQSPRSNVDWSRGGYGSTSENYQQPRSYQGSMAPSAAGMSGNELVTNGPQGTPPADWSARQNVIQSHHYTRLLETSPSFRHARMSKECGPITDPQLHSQCLASFGEYAPSTMSGSSMAPTTYRNGSGS